MEKGIKAKGKVERTAFDPRVLVFIKRECFSHSLARVHRVGLNT